MLPRAGHPSVNRMASIHDYDFRRWLGAAILGPMTNTKVLLAGCALALTIVAGCAGDHPLVTSATGDLACEPEQLRSAWWSDGRGPFYGGNGEIVLNAAGTHVLLEDMFRSQSIRLADGVRSEAAQLTVELTDVAGVRFAMPRMQTDAEGRSDFAGATDVFAIGTPTPLAGIPWIVPRDASGYTQVAAHVAQAGDHAVLVERAVRFGAADAGVWLRSVRVSSPSDEIRVDLASALTTGTGSYESPFSILVDETHGVVFVTLGRQLDAPPSITRVDLASRAVTTTVLTLDPAAPLLGIAHVGEPGTQLLDVALASDGSVLFVTTRDGRLRVIDAATLAEAGAEVPVGVVVANADTYLPSVRSPVAVSAHDELLAMLDEMGRVVIVDAATMAPLATLTSQAPLLRDIDLMVERGPRPIALRFLDDGLLVVTDTGAERFACAI